MDIIDWKGMKKPRLVREYSRRDLKKPMYFSVKNGPGVFRRVCLSHHLGKRSKHSIGHWISSLLQVVLCFHFFQLVTNLNENLIFCYTCIPKSTLSSPFLFPISLDIAFSFWMNPNSGVHLSWSEYEEPGVGM